MNIILKSWIYEEIQSKAFCKGKTIVWKKQLEYGDDGKVITSYVIKVDHIVKETEKAICFDCVYWYHGSRTVNFTEYTGYKVWIPKSAILKYDNRGFAVSM